MALGFPDRGNAPFLWGRGGRRTTPEDIALRRRFALQQQAQGSDTSPVGHWTAGAARLLTGLSGGLNMRRADREAEARAEELSNIAHLLTSGGQMPDGSDPVAAALAFPELEDMAELAFKQRNPAPVEPVIQRANNGDIIGLNPMTGEVMFTQADPNPKPVLNWQRIDNGDGTFTFQPFDANGPVMPGAAGAMPPATLPPDFDFEEGGPASAPGGFPYGQR